MPTIATSTVSGLARWRPVSRLSRGPRPATNPFASTKVFMKWLRTLPKEPGIYVIGLGKSYRVELAWTALAPNLQSLELFRAANAILKEAGATFGELWVRGDGAPAMSGMWIPPLERGHEWFNFGSWVTCTKSGQGPNAVDPAAVMLLGPGVLTWRRALHHHTPKAAKALVHLPEAEEHQFQRGQASKICGEPFWERDARKSDYISVHTFTAAGLKHRYFSVDCSWAHSLSVCVDDEWRELAT